MGCCHIRINDGAAMVIVETGNDIGGWAVPGIGSTDAAVIMGVDPSETIESLRLLKALGARRKLAMNRHIRRGLVLEKYVREFLNRKLGLQLLPARVMSDNYSFIRSSLDGLDADRAVIVEIKCPSSMYPSVPIHYYMQVQHHLLVTGYDMCLFVCYCQSKTIIHHIKRDRVIIEQMLKKELVFWEEVQKLRRCIIERLSALVHNEDGLSDEVVYLLDYLKSLFSPSNSL